MTPFISSEDDRFSRRAWRAAVLLAVAMALAALTAGCGSIGRWMSIPFTAATMGDSPLLGVVAQPCFADGAPASCPGCAMTIQSVPFGSSVPDALRALLAGETRPLTVCCLADDLRAKGTSAAKCASFPLRAVVAGSIHPSADDPDTWIVSRAKVLK